MDCDRFRIALPPRPHRPPPRRHRGAAFGAAIAAWVTASLWVPPPALASDMPFEEVRDRLCPTQDGKRIAPPEDTSGETRRVAGALHPVKYTLGPLKLAIPWNYLDHIPFAVGLMVCEPTPLIAIQFWIPSLDAPERQFVGREYRPSEAKRPTPGADESIVGAWIRYYGPGAPPPLPGDGPPDRMIESLLAEHRRVGNGKLRSTEEHGLTKMERQSSRSIVEARWFKRGDRETVFVECRTNGFCSGLLDLKELPFTIRFNLTRDALPQHPVIIQGLRTLLDRWKRQEP